jgi:hypothetical protein
MTIVSFYLKLLLDLHFHPEDGDITFSEMSVTVPDYLASHPRGHYCPSVPTFCVQVLAVKDPEVGLVFREPLLST